MTGRGAGPCAGGQGAPARGWFGRGGMRRGLGRRFPWFAAEAPTTLEEQEQALEAELQAIRKARKEQKKS